MPDTVPVNVGISG